MSINRVIITGNLTRDPELRSTASGMPVLGFGVAVNDRRRNQQTGEWEDYPNFIDCTMFGARAESVSRLEDIILELERQVNPLRRQAKKADQYLKYKEELSRIEINVIVDEIEFLSRNDGSRGGAPMQQSAPQPQAMPVQQAPAPVATPVVDASVYDEDIPF